MSGQRIESTSPRSNGYSNRFSLAGVSLPHDICRSRPKPEPTYINPHSDPPKRELVCATREHSTPPPCTTPGGFTGCVHATLTISHTQCAVVFSHNGIAEAYRSMWPVLQGLEQASLQRTVLNRHKRDRYDQANLSAQEPITTSPARSQFNIIIIMVFSRSKNEAEKNQGKTYISRMMKPSFNFYRSLSITKH